MYRVVIHTADNEETKVFDDYSDAIKCFCGVSGRDGVNKGVKKSILCDGERDLFTFQVISFI